MVLSSQVGAVHLSCSFACWTAWLNSSLSCAQQTSKLLAVPAPCHVYDQLVLVCSSADLLYGCDLQEKAALLPPEPSSNAEGPIVSCLFRMPDGTRASRVFLQSQPANLLFDFADAKGAGGLPFGGYRLVMQFPRRVIDGASVQTMNIVQAGLTSPQEVLLLEAIHEAESSVT